MKPHLQSALVLALLVAPPALPEAAAAERIELSPSASVPAPAATRPMNERRFDFEVPAEGSVTLQWEAVPGARLYQVQLAGAGDFAKLLNPSDQFVLGEGVTGTELVGLPEGGYYWRVAAIDGEGRRSAWSGTRVFSINEGAPANEGEGPMLEITSTTPLGAKALVAGRTDADGRLEAWVNGVPAGDIPLASGGDFSVMLDANLIGKNVVRLIAVDKRGRTTYAETSFRYAGN